MNLGTYYRQYVRGQIKFLS